MMATSNRHLTSPARWEPECVETRVLEITCEQFGCRREDVSLDARLGEIIAGDSLDMMAYVMELEQAFHIAITDEMAQGWFTHQPLSIRNIAAMVWHLQGMCRPDRGVRTRLRQGSASVEAVPFTAAGVAIELSALRGAVGICGPRPRRSALPLGR
jgi:acyl carrier protein